MTTTTLIELLESPDPAKIMAQVELHKVAFLEFLKEDRAGEILDSLQEKYGGGWLARLLEAGAGPLPEEDLIYLEKYDLGLTFRTILLPSLPAHLLIFRTRFSRVEKIDPERHRSLLLEPDVEAALSPESCLPPDFDHLKSTVAKSIPHSATRLEEVNEKHISEFVDELIWLGITPSTFLKALDFITDRVRTIVDTQDKRLKKGIPLTFNRGRYILNEDDSIDLRGQISSICNLTRPVSACLMDWLINIARWKPHLFGQLKAKPRTQGVLLFYKENAETDLFTRWRNNAKRCDAFDPHKTSKHERESVMEMFEQIKHTDRACNEEDLLNFSYELGRERLFSAEPTYQR